MDAGPAPSGGMTISIRTRRDVVVVDPERFLAAARLAYRELNPELTEAEAAERVADVYDAADALLERHGHLAAEDVGTAIARPATGSGAPPPGGRTSDRPDGLSPAGWIQAIVIDDPQPLQDYGCFLPDDPFALPASTSRPGKH